MTNCSGQQRPQFAKAVERILISLCVFHVMSPESHRCRLPSVAVPACIHGANARVAEAKSCGLKLPLVVSDCGYDCGSRSERSEERQTYLAFDCIRTANEHERLFQVAFT
jgi:hypothetical protein